MAAKTAFRMPDLIAKKRDRGVHSPDELAFIAKAAADGGVPDYQLSAWLMAVLLNGLRHEETVALTEAMASSGRRIRLGDIKAAKVDKHSTGGVGDGISLALSPMVAAAGAAVPMMSGRGLGHTGGTLDKLEAMKGFKVRLTPDVVERQMRAIGVCMYGQSADLAPSDRKLYALRDATATVQSVPLIVASILSKKLSEDLDALVLDIKCGAGAIFQEPAQAEVLAQALIRTAKGLGLKCVGLLTAMEQPLGRNIGNALELKQAVDILHGDFSAEDYVEVLMALGGWMIHLAGKARTPREGEDRCREAIRSGKALEVFKKMVKAQGGDPRVGDNPGRWLPKADKSLPLKAPRAGYVVRFNARSAGRACVALGGGRDRMEDSIDYGAGIVLFKKVGDAVKPGEEIARLYACDPARLKTGHAILSDGVEIGKARPRVGPVIIKTWK